jgi:hypothetical protein
MVTSGQHAGFEHVMSAFTARCRWRVTPAHHAGLTILPVNLFTVQPRGNGGESSHSPGLESLMSVCYLCPYLLLYFRLFHTMTTSSLFATLFHRSTFHCDTVIPNFLAFPCPDRLSEQRTQHPTQSFSESERFTPTSSDDDTVTFAGLTYAIVHRK